MSKARKKKRVINEVIDRVRAEEIYAEYASLDNQIETITVKMDMEMNAIRDKHLGEISKLRELHQDKFDLLEHFAATNKDLFKKSKTMFFNHGKLGFRIGTPKLKPLPGFTFKKILGILKFGFNEFLVTSQAIDKEKLITGRNDEDIKKLFPIMGVEIVQDEIFFVEPKKEEA